MKKIGLIAAGLACLPARSQVDEQPLVFDPELETVLYEDSAAADSGAAEAGNSLWHSLAENALFTYRHQLSYQTGDAGGVQTNRTSLRLQWEKLLGTNYFFRYDGTSLLYFSDDRQAENAGDSLLYRHNVRELYLQASWGKTSVALGKQVVIWGESEVSPVTDELSPRNIEDFYFTSLDEARIGQNLLKIDRYGDSGQWSLIVIPDPAVDTEPLLGNDFDIEGNDLSGFSIVENNRDQLGTEVGLRWKDSFWKGDFSVMAADLIDNQPVYTHRDGGSGAVLPVAKEYRRFQMLGAAANLGLGVVSLSLEAAYKKGLSFLATSPYSSDATPSEDDSANRGGGYREKNTFEAAVSLEYSVDATQSVYFGYASQHIAGGVADIDEADSDRNDITLGWSDKYLHELLSVSYNFQYQFEDKNTVHTLSGSYALTDDLFLNLDLFVLKTSDKERFSFFDQTSLMFTVEYNF